jgi:hypothetical protein
MQGDLADRSRLYRWQKSQTSASVETRGQTWAHNDTVCIIEILHDAKQGLQPRFVSMSFYEPFACLVHFELERIASNDLICHENLEAISRGFIGLKMRVGRNLETQANIATSKKHFYRARYSCGQHHS